MRALRQIKCPLSREAQFAGVVGHGMAVAAGGSSLLVGIVVGGVGVASWRRGSIAAKVPVAGSRVAASMSEGLMVVGFLF